MEGQRFITENWRIIWYASASARNEWKKFMLEYCICQITYAKEMAASISIWMEGNSYFILIIFFVVEIGKTI